MPPVPVTWPRVCIVGPLPPPSGGMANQCEQLRRLLAEEGVVVEVVRTNAPYRPAWTGQLPVLRAGVRLVAYLGQLWRALARADVVHVFANSGWSWHLFALPALLVARWRGAASIVNYRGGQAEAFFTEGPRHVVTMLASASLRVTPSAYLHRVFAKFGLTAQVIPNIIDLTRFSYKPVSVAPGSPHLIITRNLEPIYDIPTGLRAFAKIRQTHPGARLTIAGTGPERAALEDLARSLSVADAVTFAGRIANADIAALYASADCMLNPTTVDNMPISILEALASGVPVVTTDAGGIPDLVTNEETALLVPVGDDAGMARAALRVFGEVGLAQGLCERGYTEVQRYAWSRVKLQWREAYLQATRMGPRAASHRQEKP